MPAVNPVEITCKCGCGEKFTKNSLQHIYFDGPRCRQKDIRNRISTGELQPTYYNECEVCQEPVPVYREIPASAYRLTCDNKCGAILRARKGLNTTTLDSTIKQFRQTYCRQSGECGRYSKCLDLGARKQWPRDRGQECFEKVDKPPSDYDRRPAIQMEPHSTMAKEEDG